MPTSCVNTGNENVTKGEPKGGVREAVANPLIPQTQGGGSVKMPSPRAASFAGH
jgi:hypothetical protein